MYHNELVPATYQLGCPQHSLRDVPAALMHLASGIQHRYLDINIECAAAVIFLMPKFPDRPGLETSLYGNGWSVLNRALIGVHTYFKRISRALSTSTSNELRSSGDYSSLAIFGPSRIILNNNEAIPETRIASLRWPVPQSLRASIPLTSATV